MDDEDPVRAGYCPFTSEGQDAAPAVLAAARREQPVFASPEMGAWMVTRHEDADGVLRDPATFSSRGALGPENTGRVAEVLAEGRVSHGATLIGWDAPEHDRMRAVLAAAFTPRRSEALAPVIRARTDAVLDGLAGRDRVDVLPEIAMPIALATILDLIGVPDSGPERAELLAWSQDWGRLYGAELGGVDEAGRLALAGSAVRLHRYIADLIAARRAEPRDDLVSAALDAQRAVDEPLSETERIALFSGLIFAGYETTANLVTTALWLTLAHPDRAAAASPQALIEETARLESPIASMSRTATRTTRLGGIEIAAGDRVTVAFGSANRDEALVADPDAFRPERADGGRHMAFGRGPHYCIGARLARVEATTVLTVLRERWPAMALAETPRWAGHFFLHGLQSLVVAPG